MASPAQVTANHANAQKSTGPRTEEGKKTSSRNAMTHGIYSTAKVIPGESEEAYDAFFRQSLISLCPANSIEVELAAQIANDMWRLERIRRIEQAEWEKGTIDLRRMNIISQMISRIRRDVAGGLSSFASVQRHRQKQEKEQLPDAATIRRADLLTNSPTDLDRFGFDLSLGRVEAQIARQDAVQNAGQVVKTASLAKAA
jgi:hypothetical protein